MEESLIAKIKETFDCKEQDIRSYSALPLALVGDAIYDLIVRTVVCERGNRPVKDLHRTAVKAVNAGAQARMIEALLPELTEEEAAVYKRGRNAKPYTMAKNASMSDYRKATGFEALMGYLYLQDRTDRVLELVKKGLELTDLAI